MNYDKEDVNPLLASINWEHWLYGPGMTDLPADTFETEDSLDAKNLALAYIALNGTGYPENWEDYNGFFSNL